MYLDAGFDVASNFIKVNFRDQFDGISEQSAFKDAKSQLQETMQKQGYSLPRYEIVETLGEQHEQEFTVECTLQEMKISRCSKAYSRRSAEQSAAEKVLGLFLKSNFNKLKKAK